MFKSILPLLACPTCRNESLTFDGYSQDDRLVDGSLTCVGCGRVYPVENEIADLSEHAEEAGEWEWEVDIENLDTFAAFDTAYTQTMPATVLRNYPPLINRIMRVANQSEGPILDVATGRGVLLREMALLLATNQPVIGVDIDMKVLRGLQRFLRRKGLYDEVSLISMDAKRLALHSNAIGAVTSWFGFNNVPDVASAIREAQRVLAPGGRLAAAILNVDPTSTTYHVAAEAGFSDLLTDENTRINLTAAALQIEKLETYAAGIWPGNPYDALPLKGESFSHRLLVAQKD